MMMNEKSVICTQLYLKVVGFLLSSCATDTCVLQISIDSNDRMSTFLFVCTMFFILQMYDFFYD